MLFSITTTFNSETGLPVSFVLDANVDSLQALHERLADDGCILGVRYKVRSTSRGPQLTNPRDCLLSLGGLAVAYAYDDGEADRGRPSEDS